VLIDESAWRDDAGYSSSVLGLAFCLRWRIIEELIAYGNMLVEVLHQDFEIAIELVRREAGLGVRK